VRIIIESHVSGNSSHEHYHDRALEEALTEVDFLDIITASQIHQRLPITAREMDFPTSAKLVVEGRVPHGSTYFSHSRRHLAIHE
jgi:hypothetical protein